MSAHFRKLKLNFRISERQVSSLFNLCRLNEVEFQLIIQSTSEISTSSFLPDRPGFHFKCNLNVKFDEFGYYKAILSFIVR